MSDRWSLDILYKGYDDEKFIADYEKLDSQLAALQELQQNLSNMKESDALKAIIEKLEAYYLNADHLMHYASLNNSADTTNNQHIGYMNNIANKLSNSSKVLAQFQRYIASIDNLDECIKEANLAEYHFFLTNLKKDGKHLLSDEAEEIYAKMDLYAGNAWSNLQTYLTSTLEVSYRGAKIPLSQARNLAYDNDPSVRKDAYEAELRAYNKIKDAIAFSLNNIKAQVKCICNLKGYDSPLDYTLKQAHMQKATLDAMFAAIDDYLPYFHKYLKRKSEILGYENGLPWFELFAPMGESKTKFTIESTKDYLIDHFKDFSIDLCDMIEEAFANDWIDFYPRKGKSGGAFCAGLCNLKQSRILTNFNGELGDVVTLAHELGHAYHNRNIEENSILNYDYSMPVAETASTFNENIIMNCAIDEASDEDKLGLIENQLQDLNQIICDIYSRYLFETKVFEDCSDQFLMADQLEAIMLDAQKQAYGDGLDHNYLHPYMWVNKSHYYSSQISFYNFPYAFGGLFARGLVVKYQELKEDFLPKYKELLKATTNRDVEEVAKVLDIDLTSKAFWESALETAKQRINEFITLSDNLIQK